MVVRAGNEYVVIFLDGLLFLDKAMECLSAISDEMLCTIHCGIYKKNHECIFEGIWTNFC